LKEESQLLTSQLYSLKEDAKAMDQQLASQVGAIDRIKSEATRALQSEAVYRAQLEAQLKASSEVSSCVNSDFLGILKLDSVDYVDTKSHSHYEEYQ
jgi:uncharacterized phage infection (PIP) family protein YhgE